MNTRPVRAIAERFLARALPSLTVLLLLGTPLFAQSEKSTLSVLGDAGAIGWLICVLSIVALAVIIENFVSLNRDKLAPPEVIDDIQMLFEEGNYQEAMELCENDPCFFTNIVSAGVYKVSHSFTVIEQAIGEKGDEESIRLHQKIGWLSLIANIAPMMGLLGTVSGMVKAFNEIATSGGQANPADLAKGISEALLTTLLGLTVAIPTTAAFAFLRNRLVKTVIEVGSIVEEIFDRFRPEGS